MGILTQERATEVDPFGSPVGVNNFSIVAATVNGSGSQTANNTIARALFKMGIPTTGKNLFPSNIQGLPTWYIIRLSREGYIGRRENSEILIAMNPVTATEDMANVPAGGVIIYPSEWKMTVETRTDVTYYALPVQQFAKASGAAPKMVAYVANMAYVGALAELLGIDLDEIDAALMWHFGGKRKAVDLNMGVIKAAIEYVKTNITKRDPFKVERMQANTGKVLIEGNAAAGLGSCFGGFTVAAWYPITPSTSVVDSLTEYAKELRVDPITQEHTYAIIQAEDEIAAIGMIVGAGWAGARAMTATSGPGISLMTEYAGYAYFTEIPIVVWDIMRMGPATGLPTRVSQGDVLSVYYLGHGDTKQVVLFPAHMQECFDFGWQSFDLAERLQTPIFVLSDLDLGMNTWMTDAFVYPDQPMDRGKVLTAEELNAAKTFNRYEDHGDGVGPRTIPGTDSPYAAYFTRGSGHNKYAQYTERADEWVAGLEHLHRKHEFARTLVPAALMDEVEGAEVGIIAYGSTDQSMPETRAELAKRGIKTSYLRIRALPTTSDVLAFIRKYPRLYVVENNFDGQMHKILQTETPDCAANLMSLAQCDGLPLTSEWIATSILKREQH